MLKYRRSFVEDILDIQPSDREKCNMLIVLLVVGYTPSQFSYLISFVIRQSFILPKQSQKSRAFL